MGPQPGGNSVLLPEGRWEAAEGVAVRQAQLHVDMALKAGGPDSQGPAGGGAGRPGPRPEPRLANGRVRGLHRLRLLSAHVGFARGAWREHTIIYNLLSAREMLSNSGSAQDR